MKRMAAHGRAPSNGPHAGRQPLVAHPPGTAPRARPQARTRGLLARTRLTTWAPRRRTHLLCLLCATLGTVWQMSNIIDLSLLYGHVGERIALTVIGGIGLAMVSVWPLGGTAVCVAAACVYAVAYGHMAGVDPISGIEPWLCASVLLTRGFSRATAYGAVAVSSTVALLVERGYIATVPPYEYYPVIMVWGLSCLVIAELMRQPRMQTELSAHRYRADLERQRLLVVSELHDTVVRDLTRAVMAAEQARLSQPQGASMAAELAAMTASVRTAVEQLRNNLRALGEVDGDSGLDVLASSAPRPLEEVVEEARTLMAGRGIVLEVDGLRALERAEIGPGLRLQLVRVSSELVSNMAKHAGQGAARFLMDSDRASLEIMASNARPADGGAHRGQAPADRQDGSGPVGDPQEHGTGWDDGMLSSGLGLRGVERRVQALGGSVDIAAGPERFTVVVSVPLVAAAG